MTEETKNETQNGGSANQPKKSICLAKIFFILNAVVLALIIALYFFTCPFTCKSKAEEKSTQTVEPANYSNMKFAYVNTDSILIQYKMAIELEKELLNYRKTIETNYKNKVEKLQNDYQEYLRIGATLTLTEQKKREDNFKLRGQEIEQLQGTMVAQVQDRQQIENSKLINAIYAFIREYNKTHQQFNIIFKKSFSESPLLYIDENMDITKEIIKGLNEEYDAVNGKKTK